MLALIRDADSGDDNRYCITDKEQNNDANSLSQNNEQWHLTLLIAMKLNTLVINCK